MRSAFTVSFISFALLSHAALAANDAWQPTVEVEGRVNSDRSLIAPKLLIPVLQDENSMLFTDIRTRLDNKNSEEYNLGLGYRQIVGDWVLGGYGFVDHLNSRNDFDYWQGTAGLEALSNVWEARINGYLPEATTHNIGNGGALVVSGSGGFGITGINQERALPGVDAEIGYKLPIQTVDLKLFGGGYYFDAEDFDSVAGPKARLELMLDNRVFNALPDGVQFTVGVQYQNDGADEDQTTALAQIRIPLGKALSYKQDNVKRRMTDFIRRDIDIIAKQDKSSTIMPATVTINNQQYSNIAATIDANTGNVNTAVNNAGANSLVVIDGSAGVITTNNTAPLAGQALIGGGAQVTAHAGNMTANGILPGTRPVLDGNIISFANNVTIKNIDITQSGTTAIFAGSDNWLIDDVHATSTYSSGYGIRVFSSNGTLINNVTAESPNFAAIGIENSSNITMNDVTLIGTDGIELGNSSFVSGAPDATGTSLACIDLGGNANNSINFVGGGTCP